MKVSVKYSGPGTTAQTWFEGLTRNMISGIETVITSAVKEGEEIVKDNIETRGTFKSGKRGRIDTGEMRDAVDSRVTSQGNRGVTGSFGWIGNFEDYFGYQEDGFIHLGGVEVQGMYAISDAAEEVFRNIDDSIDQVIRNA